MSYTTTNNAGTASAPAHAEVSRRRRRIGSAALTVFALLGALVASATQPAGAQEAAPGIDNFDRDHVASTYWSSIQQNLSVSANWSGSTETCVAGAASQEFTDATLESINWFRQMAGLAPVTEDPAASEEAQAAALMMQAQRALSHFPGPDWSCYSDLGSDGASQSNLYLGRTGVRATSGFIEDPGANNVALGHRRWILYSRLGTVGIGNTSSASALHVIGGWTPERYSETDWVSWPPPGFVPEDVIYPRWSTSFVGDGVVDFSDAQVTVTRDGESLDVTMLPVVAGFADPTLGWEVDTAGAAPGDNDYVVDVTGVTVGDTEVSRTYTVTSFYCPGVAGASGCPDPAKQPVCEGLAVTVDLSQGQFPTNGDDVILGTPNNDVIHGFGGDDVICGGLGDDFINGGDGADKIYGGWGDDALIGEVGNDLLVGSRGVDTVWGGAGNDRIQGGDGGDTLYGENGTDIIRAGNGNDTIYGGAHDDKIWGNLGRDSLYGENGDDVVRGGAWKDVLNGGSGDNDGCTLTDPGGLSETRIDCEAGVFGR